MIIAIDGPAGAGKSTVCKLLAKRLGFVYLDTGAMYRAVAWALEFGGDSMQAAPAEEKLCGMLERMPLQFAIEKNSLEISYGSKTLSEELRSPEITEAASRISRLPAVRRFLVEWQRKLARQGTGIVAEGRDTATVVFPDAQLKVFLTADLKTRAQRRLAQYNEKGANMSLEQIEGLIHQRDEADSKRDHSPMRQAQGAFLLDSSGLSVQEVVDVLGEKAREVFSRQAEKTRRG